MRLRSTRPLPPRRRIRPASSLPVKSGLGWALVSLISLIVAAGLILGVPAYKRDLAAARARIAHGSRVVQTACGPIEYGEAGSGPPVLVIHGAGGGFDQGLAMGAPLVAAGYRVIAPSRFGYLRTPMPAHATPNAQADAHACLLDALHVPRAIVAAGSAGAPSALRLCLRHPGRCRALVLVSPMTWAPPRPKGAHAGHSALVRTLLRLLMQSDVAYWSLLKVSPEALVQWALATPAADYAAAPPAEQARALALLRDVLPITPRAAGLWFDATVQPRLHRQALGRLTVPTLVAAVEDDGFGFYRGALYTAASIPHAEFVAFRTGGHLWLGHQAALWQDISNFLARLPP